MHIADTIMEALLKKGGLASDTEIDSFKKEAESSHDSIQTIVLRKGVVNDIDLVRLYGDYAGIPYVYLDPNELAKKVLEKVPEHIARQYNAILFSIDETGDYHVAMEDPDDIQAINFLEKHFGRDIVVHIATLDNILMCLEIYSGDVTEKLNDVIDIQREEGESEQASDKEISEDSPIAKTINLLLEYAIRSSASDIHIEPRETFIQIRYRIDGVLHEVNRLPRNVSGALISRVKILANLKIDERRVPQDGRFKIKVAGRQYALRVSTLPIADGEKIVMRILNESNQAVTLQELGYWGHSLKTLSNALNEANGMVLITGPTGSGKSTSLFSILTLLNTPDVNISTIEDPVEYKIPGVNQTQTNPKAGMTFSSGLRALLRQDPNIIMVGEIRDGETANLGVQAALTGHLVFSTLHTNNAATTLPRLLDMEIEPFLIASTVRVVVGQRLVRRLCTNCRQEYQPDQSEQASVLDSFHLTANDIATVHGLNTQAASEKLGEEAALSTSEESILSLWKASPEGCTECNGSGFKGRIGIYEVLGNSHAIERLIMANATSTQIQSQAITEGMLTMQTDGLIKALRGLTTVEEILRATRD